MPCVMCRELHGIETCVTGCYYAALVAQGVVNPLQLAQLCSMYIPSAIHRRMTDAPPEERVGVIESFLYHYWARSKDMLRGSMGILEDLSAELAEKNAEVQKLEAELADLKWEHKEKFAAEMVSDDDERLKLELEAELAELQLALKINEKKAEVLKVEDEIDEHKLRCSGRRYQQR
ncbi:hypothetical protein SSX86_005357 [Deinandra increscens subsp. villosa]|uniref:LOB domain-containing protein n=1 Tax=Deinandra increscens subsp. villosa TaxID=3103831 RepID=A0AAP0H9Z1_9ASTR